MVNTATEQQTAPGKRLARHEQLATLHAIRACITNGERPDVIVAKLETASVDNDERSQWAKVRAGVAASQSFNAAVVDTGLFSTDVDRIFSVVTDLEKAITASIEHLSAALVR